MMRVVETETDYVDCSLRDELLEEQQSNAWLLHIEWLSRGFGETGFVDLQQCLCCGVTTSRQDIDTIYK